MRNVTTPAERPTVDPLTHNLLASLNTRELTRLLHYWYLTEWKHAITTGQPITTHQFRKDRTSTNEQILEAALECKDFPRCWLARARLPRTARAAVNHVLRTCSPLRPSELDRLVRSTHPYLTLSTGDPIDFVRLAREYQDFLDDTGLSAPGQAPKLEIA